ncbi:VWA-like domain-containing protein [Secundilactobacillus folii]|uniref:VWA-like domain-containing protein n=1 Tax=Secundilactobacillus folii TaxID=2678357 RepID=UPI0015663457
MTQLQELKQQTDNEKYTRQFRAIFQQFTRQMLNSQRFYGEMLLRLDKRIDRQLPVAMTLTTGEKLTLVLNPDQLAEVAHTDGELTAMLAHVVAHLAWQHPKRYAAQGNSSLVRLATDIVVNDHLQTLFPGAITRAKLNFKLGLHLPPELNSADYLRRIKAALATDKTGHKATQVKRILGQSPEDHRGWQPLSQTAKMQLAEIRNGAWQGTPDKQRGILPNRLQHELAPQTTHLALDWRQLIMLGLNGPLKRQQPAFNRFNRRQPYRLELPGRSLTSTRRLYFFIDESGSMSDSEVQTILAQVAQLLRRYRDQVTVLPFDAVVHADHQQRLAVASQLEFKRFAGGGTTFQAIFDWLQMQGANDLNAVVLILTDGHGEQRVDTHGLTNIIWGLTTSVADLSIKQPVGRVTVIHERS